MKLNYIVQLMALTLIISLPLFLLNKKSIVSHEWAKKEKIFIHFWADWCKPCIEELPSLDEGLKNSNNEVFKILYTLDSSKNTLEQLNELQINHFDTIVFTKNNQTEFDFHFNSFESKVVPRNLILAGKELDYKSTGIDTNLIVKLTK